MTISEIIRYIESRKRIQKTEAQERASYDYILADLIGHSIARVYSSANHMPKIHEVYPTLFDSQQIEEQKAAKQTELSVLRFKQFAASYNKRFTEAANKNE